MYLTNVPPLPLPKVRSFNVCGFVSSMQTHRVSRNVNSTQLTHIALRNVDSTCMNSSTAVYLRKRYAAIVRGDVVSGADSLLLVADYLHQKHERIVTDNRETLNRIHDL